MDEPGRSAAATYLNPVYPHSFPDPFVLKFQGKYFAYATGFAADGTVFPVIRSSDLVTWNASGGAMQPLESAPPYYWAPEVSYDNGKFYLYYSAGNERFMELRVAVSDRPDRDFVDAGVRLTNEDFAIDAHVFVDDDGTKYLFYATDFLEYSHIGTGTVVDRMLDWFTLAGDPKPVTRAMYDWQVYDPNRKEKGGVRWHTVEGPAVLKRKGKYYEMFSGGNWQNTSYGVSFALSDRLDKEEEWLQFSDGVRTLPVLRTIPGLVVGPGHNCVVRGPNNRELYCVYHRWTEAGRVMAIDRLDFAGDRIFVVGATHTPQPTPYAPKVKKRSHDSIAHDGRQLQLTEVPESFLLELTSAFGQTPDADDEFDLGFETDSDRTIMSFSPTSGITYTSQSGITKPVALPAAFVWTAPHLLRIEADYRRLHVSLDGATITEEVLESPIRRVAVSGAGESVLSSTLELTEGFEELFEHALPIGENGWTVDCDGRYESADGELQLESPCRLLLRKGPAYENLEVAANIRVLDGNASEGEFGLALFDGDDEVFSLNVDRGRSTIATGNGTLGSKPLPENIRLSQHHQLRIVKLGERCLCYFDDVLVADQIAGLPQTSAGVFANGVRVAIEMIRVTAI